MRSGICSARPKSEHLTSESASSYWPTPTAANSRGYNQSDSPNAKVRDGLERLAKNWIASRWPTPCAADSEKRGAHGNGSPTLPSSVARWSTPTVAASTGGAPQDSRGKRDLRLDLKAWADPDPSDPDFWSKAPFRGDGMTMWPTPTANEATGYMSGANSDTWRPTLKAAALGARPTRGRPDRKTEKPGPNGLVLNPLFVEALMGWPIGWTDCGSSETESCPKTPTSPYEPWRRGPRVLVGPLPIKKAIPFVKKVHRRLPKVQGAMWSVAAKIEGEIVGVALVAHPVARKAAKKWSAARVPLEVTRVAVVDGAKNACSALYAACSRAARGMGASDLWTSVHADESGHSLKAAGWVCLGPCGGGEWSRSGRRRDRAVDPERKVKWAVPWGELARKKAREIA